MTGEIINLRRARKARARDEAAAKAKENRLAFGRSRAERELTGALQRLEADKFEAHRRDESVKAFSATLSHSPGEVDDAGSHN